MQSVQTQPESGLVIPSPIRAYPGASGTSPASQCRPFPEQQQDAARPLSQENLPASSYCVPQPPGTRASTSTNPFAPQCTLQSETRGRDAVDLQPPPTNYGDQRVAGHRNDFARPTGLGNRPSATGHIPRLPQLSALPLPQKYQQHDKDLDALTSFMGQCAGAAAQQARRQQVRATQACNHCRTRKQKCDEARPCHYCRENNLDCQYKTVPPPKSVPNPKTNSSH